MLQIGKVYFFIFLFLLAASFEAGAETFRFKDSTGKLHTLSDYKGRWVLVNFWATWCPPCLKEIPDLVSLYESRDDVMIIGVAIEEENAQVVLDYAKSMSISYPIVLGNRHIASQLDEVSMLPSTYIFDPDGQPAARHLGLITRADIEAFIKSKMTQGVDKKGTP